MLVFFVGQANNFTATAVRLNQTLELGTNYTFIFSADTDWTLHQLVFTSDAVGGLGAATPQLDKSIPVGPFPGLGATANGGFSLNFIVSVAIGVGKTIWVQSPDRAGEGFAFPLVVQAAPFVAPATAPPTADLPILFNPNFGRAGDNFVIHHSLLQATGTGTIQFSVNGGAIAKPNGQTLEGGTNYTFVFGTDTNWVDHSVFFTSDPTGANTTAIANIPLGPWPAAAGAGSTLAFVIPTALIGQTIFIQGNRVGEGSPIKIVSQVPPYIVGGGPSFQDPATFPAVTTPVVPAATAKGNGADSTSPLAFASIVALSLALVTASKYL